MEKKHFCCNVETIILTSTIKKKKKTLLSSIIYES